jgi:hypothetical protein
MSDQNTSLKQKKTTQKCSKHTEYDRKTNFSAILKIIAILKTCNKNFKKFEAFIWSLLSEISFK